MHWYGKAEVAPQRKVGHVTIVAPNAAEARSRLAAVDPGAAAALASTSGMLLSSCSAVQKSEIVSFVALVCQPHTVLWVSCHGKRPVACWDRLCRSAWILVLCLTVSDSPFCYVATSSLLGCAGSPQSYVDESATPFQDDREGAISCKANGVTGLLTSNF